jgi:hypothetical protein
MTGKEKCTLLKQIRKEIAESNGIVYLTSECTFDGECRGTCPKCDAEIRYLDDELQRKIDRGEKVTLAGLSLSTYSQAVGDANGTKSETLDDDQIIVEGECEPTLGVLGPTIDENLDGVSNNPTLVDGRLEVDFEDESGNIW